MRHFLCSLLTGCFSVCIFGGFVFMWFSSGGRCLYYRTKFLHTLDWHGLSYVSSLVHSEGWLTASPDDSRDLTSGIRHSIKQFLSCVCLMCSELDLLLRPPPLPTSEYSDGHLAEIFPSAFIQVSQPWGFSNVDTGLRCVRWLLQLWVLWSKWRGDRCEMLSYVL